MDDTPEGQFADFAERIMKAEDPNESQKLAKEIFNAGQRLQWAIACKEFEVTLKQILNGLEKLRPTPPPA